MAQEIFSLCPMKSFELGLGRGELLVYLYLVYHKSLKHVGKLSCAIIGRAVGLCEKTVRTHLRTLVNKRFIQLENNNDQLAYTICPIWDKVNAHHGADLLFTSEGGESG